MVAKILPVLRLVKLLIFDELLQRYVNAILTSWSSHSTNLYVILHLESNLQQFSMLFTNTILDYTSVDKIIEIYNIIE